MHDTYIQTRHRSYRSWTWAWMSTDRSGNASYDGGGQYAVKLSRGSFRCAL